MSYAELAALPSLPDASEHAVLDQQLHASIAQHRELLAALRNDLEMEQRKLLLRELRAVADALVARSSTTPPPTVSEKQLMSALVAITNRAFPDNDQCIQLRFLLETMLNALWEQPAHPYVPTQNYDPDVVRYVKEAGIVDPHPDDAECLRLIAFHEALPDAHAVRPAVYR